MAKTPAGSSAIFRAGFLVLTLAFILLIVGFVTPNWTEVTVGDLLIFKSGLWKSCTDVVGTGENCGKSNNEDEGWFLAVKTFEGVGLACFSLVLVMSFVLLVVVSNERLAQVNVYTAIFAAIFILTGTATYTFKSELDQVGYSCWMSWLSAGLLIVAIILLECARKKAEHRQMTLNNAEIVSEEDKPSYQSIQLQDLTPKTTRADQPLVDS